MATSPDHPDLPFLRAQKTNGSPMYTIGRPDGPPLWIVVHDMEYPEVDDAAEWTANYFHTGAGGRSVSSHYTCDRDSIWQCVLLQDSAWTVGNRQGNNRGINYELAGFSSQTREQWLDGYSFAMLSRVAPVMRSDAGRYGIPLRHCTIADLQAYRPGITSHNDLGVAFGGTDHTDPGTGFPWDTFMALVQGDGMQYLREPDGDIFMVPGTVNNGTGLPEAWKVAGPAAWAAYQDAGAGFIQIHSPIDATAYTVRVAGDGLGCACPPCDGGIPVPPGEAPIYALSMSGTLELTGTATPSD